MANLPRQLRTPPLAEALVEVKWGPLDKAGPDQFDPAYPLIVGRLYERIRDKYPVAEETFPSIIPANMTMHFVRHRFRAAPNSWPVVQIGPGVLTLNETQNYSWESFRDHAVNVLPKLFDVYPAAEQPLSIKSLLVRYINAKPFGYEQASVLEFLAAQLRTKLDLPTDLFKAGPNLERRPAGLRLNLSFAATEPKGIFDLNIGTGHSRDKPAVIWEFIVRSQDVDVPALPNGFELWLTSAHRLIEHWFFGLATPELLKECDAP